MLRTSVRRATGPQVLYRQHHLQKRLHNNGNQFGFCAPGLVMNGCPLQKNDSDLTRDDNLFRCTDYVPILRKIVFWQAHHHSYAVRQPHPHPFSMHSSGDRGPSPRRKHSASLLDPVGETLAKKLQQVLCRALSCSDINRPDTRFGAAWVPMNIASGTAKEHGALLILVQLLRSTRDDAREVQRPSP